MKKLFAQISYTFSNFYNNLSVQGQIVFTVIVGLILILFLILLITSIIQKISNKKKINELINNSEKAKNKEETNVKIETSANKEVSDIAKRIEDALNDESPVSLTSFEEEQERKAIISIDELMKRAKELEIVDDEDANVNYLEKYNLEPSVVEEVSNKVAGEDKKEVKAFKVSQVISPIYGVKKDVIDSEK